MMTRFAVLVASLLGIVAAAPMAHPVAAQTTTGPGLTLPNVSGTLARGGPFSGSVIITRLTARAGQLVADGTVSGTTYPLSVAPGPATDDSSTTPGSSSGTATSTAVMQSFREIPLTIADPNGGACDTLSVDLGTIFLDQTGVQLDLTAATLDVASLPRANRPLGNLLCTVASLVEAAPGGGQTATLNELLPVVNRVLASSQR